MRRLNRRPVKLLFVFLGVFLLLGAAFGPVLQSQQFNYIISKKLLILEGGAEFRSDVTLDSTADLTVGGDATVAGDVTLTGDGSFDDLLVTDTLDVNGDIDLDGDGFDVNITGGASIDADGATNVNASAGDVTIEAETGSLILKADEAVADGILLDANEATTTGVTIVVGSVSGLSIGGGLTDIGGGSGATADGDDDLLVAGDLEVDNALDVDGAATIASTLTVEGNVSDSGGTLTIADDVLIDGQADANQLIVQGNGTQTNNLLTLEQSDGTDKFTVDNSGNTVVAGTSDLQGNISDSGGTLTVADDVLIDGAADASQLTVQGYTTQTNSLLTLEQSDGTDKFSVSNEGHVVLSGEADSDTANYDNWFEISGEMTGTGTKDRNYGLVIEMTRPAGEELGSGDHDEAALKIRIDTEAVTTTAGTVLRAIDAESKADNPSGTVTNLYGASLTAKSDTGAGSVATMVALTTNAHANAEVTTEMGAADFRLYRQSANEPTSEYVIKVRNGSTSGSGADAGIYLLSDYGSSETTDSMDYGIDMASAQINQADLRLENGETIDNGTDTVIALSNFLAMGERQGIIVSEGSTITPTGTYQPISSASAVTTSATTAIADGVKNGQLLILVNENASDTIIVKDSANTHLSGDITLGNDDTLMLMWDGADWLELATSNNS